MNKITIYQEHVLEVLKGMASESVHCIVTSPPYWGLRDYGIPPLVWPAVEYAPMAGLPPIRILGDEACEHEWGEDLIAKQSGGGWAVPKDKSVYEHDIGKKDFQLGERKQGQFCRLCSAWRGCLGLEPTIDMYIGHMVLICRELCRVLRPDGVFFLNMGDSYMGSGGPGSQYDSKSTKGFKGEFQKYKNPNRGVGNLKPKDLCGVPWRLALALQADDWWLRSDIIWAKPNPMPESCTDRPTKSHEYIFLLTKSGNYFWDQEAVRENQTGTAHSKGTKLHPPIEDAGIGHKDWHKYTPDVHIPGGRNLRSVWTFATESFPGAHFATFPQELVRRCVAAATSEKGCCPKWGAQWKRVVEKTGHINKREAAYQPNNTPTKTDSTGWAPTTKATNIWLPTCACAPKITSAMKRAGCNAEGGYTGQDRKDYVGAKAQSPAETKRRILKSMAQERDFNWQGTCGHGLEPIPCTILDIFGGAMTTSLVSAKMGRDSISIELKPDYVKMGVERIKKELGFLIDLSLIRSNP